MRKIMLIYLLMATCIPWNERLDTGEVVARRPHQPESPSESGEVQWRVVLPEHRAVQKPPVEDPIGAGGRLSAGSDAGRNASAAAVEPSWVSHLEAELAAREYRASWNEYGLQAPNRAHGLRTYFDASRILVLDRTASERTELLALEAIGFGRPRVMKRVGAGELIHENARVEIRRAGWSEWYENSSSGLEQGFTLDVPPPGAGAVVVELAVGGARARRNADGVTFESASGRALHYGGLVAFDANRKRLPATIDVDADRLTLAVNDAGAAYPITIDPLLTASVDTQLGVFQATAQFGRYVAGAGDVNGDGFGDVIVGAEFYDAGHVNEGAAFVFHGGPGGILSNSAPSATLQADQEQAFFGKVASAGDVNGDGYSDVIVGAHAYDEGQSEEGAAFVFLGSATGIASGNPATAAAKLQANAPGATFGFSVASAGDANGDGYGDVVVGASSYNGRGAAFLFTGSAGGIAHGNPSTAAAAWVCSQLSSDFGLSVAGAGDINGDGYSDVIIGARSFDSGQTNEGVVYVFHGSASGIASGDQTTAASTIQSDLASASFGVSVAGAGDVNGDGYADVIVGASGYASGQTDEGAAFVFRGRVTGIPSGNLTSASATLQSNQAFAHLYSVAGAGDVNGDGYADVIVGAPDYDSGQSNEGAAFVHLGGPLGVMSGDPGTAFATLETNQAGAILGYGVAGAGDVDGDGYGDVIAGAPTWDGNLTDEGAAFIYRGGSRGIVDGSPANASDLLQSDQASASFGYSVAGAGDVNGDGYADVIVGAPGYDLGPPLEGAVFVFLGSPTGVGDHTPSTAAATLQSDQAGSAFGRSVAGAGDVNGDGYGDVIVGAPYYSAGSSVEGAAFVFLGSASGIASGDPSTAAAMLQSNQSSAQLGSSVASAGDVNGDGYADVIVGADYYDAGETNEGAAFVFLGSAGGIANGSPANAAAILQSNQAQAHLGLSVAGAGDVNGDGYADVIVGATSYTAGESAEGAAFIFHGSSSGITSGGPASAASTLQSNEPNAIFGVVAGAGDINGDGYADVIVGAPDFYAGQEGAAFVFLGSAEGISDGTPSNAAHVLSRNQPAGSFGGRVAGAGDVNGDGFADLLVGALFHDAGQSDEGAVFVYLGGPAGIASVTPAATIEANQQGAGMGWGVAAAGDVNGDGLGDVIVGTPFYDLGHADEGAALVFTGGGGQLARQAMPRQHRADGSSQPIAPWGDSHAVNAIQVRMHAIDPTGRGRVKLEVESCPPGEPFGSAGCHRTVSPVWADGGLTGVTLSHDVMGLNSGLYRWRVRTLRASIGVTEPGITAPPRPAHGPWRRLSGQAVEADVRTGASPVSVDLGRERMELGISPLGSPTRGTLMFSLWLSRSGQARLELFDPAGRRVAARQLAFAVGGRHTVELDESRRLPPGVYLARLTQGGRAFSTRVVLLR